MDVGVGLAGYDGFFSDSALCLCQAEDPDEDLREFKHKIRRLREGHLLDLQTMRLQDYEADAYLRLTSWSPDCLGRLEEEQLASLECKLLQHYETLVYGNQMRSFVSLCRWSPDACSFSGWRDRLVRVMIWGYLRELRCHFTLGFFLFESSTQ